MAIAQSKKVIPISFILFQVVFLAMISLYVLSFFFFFFSSFIVSTKRDLDTHKWISLSIYTKTTIFISNILMCVCEIQSARNTKSESSKIMKKLFTKKIYKFSMSRFKKGFTPSRLVLGVVCLGTNTSLASHFIKPNLSSLRLSVFFCLYSLIISHTFYIYLSTILH